MGTPAFAVTTRSRLKGVRFFPSMMIASWRIKRQLKQTPGCMRFASIVSGPQEVWTISVWETRDRMLEFMRSGAHEQIMWLTGKWLRSFWLMRWSPTSHEQGKWGADGLAAPPPEPDPPEEPSEEPSEEPAAHRSEALEAALDSLPRLRASIGSRGAPSYDGAPMVRRSQKAVAGGAAVLARLQLSGFHQMPAAGRDIRRLSRRVGQYDGALRWVTGMANLRERYLLVVLREEAACQQFLADPLHDELADRWGAAYWAMAWEAANEFGHWDGFRLRQVPTRKAAVTVPEHSRHLQED